MEKIKEIISQFANIKNEQITDITIIDKTVIQGSILIHRMYAEFENLGYKIENYTEIKTYGELKNKILGTENTINQNIVQPKFENKDSEKELCIGIDIEKISNFKTTNDFREDNFYKSNFSDKEISYCILQQNPIQSFAGKFSAKEAIIKADNNYKNLNFNQIEILNNELGKPYFADFEVSISHSDEYCVAVAIKKQTLNITNKEIIKTETKEILSFKYKMLILFFGIISIISLILNLLF